MFGGKKADSRSGSGTTGAPTPTGQGQPTRPPAPGASPAAPGVSASLIVESNSVVDEAAVFFANGAEDESEQLLISHLRETKGKADRRVWYMLMDLYLFGGKKEHFEKLAASFTNRFESSPPSWIDVTIKPKEKSKTAAGRNVLALEKGLTAANRTKLEDFVAAGKEYKSCRIDASRLNLDNADRNGWILLLATMHELRKAGVAATLMGESKLLDWLKRKIADSSSAHDDQVWWHAYLEIQQWQGNEADFEEVAMEFLEKFETSPPGWEPSGVMKKDGAAVIEADIASSGMEDALSWIQLDIDSVSDGVLPTIQKAIQVAVKECNEARIDFLKIKRIDFHSAGALSMFAQSIKAQNADAKIFFSGPNEMVLALLEIVNAGENIVFEPRKR